MTRRLKPLEIELSEEIQQAIKSLPVEVNGRVMTVGTLISEARSLVEAANHALSQNPLVGLTARSAMKIEKKRGIPAVVVGIEGDVKLRISYDGEKPSFIPIQARDGKLPSLQDLREQAKSLGIDVSKMGRKKLELIALIEKALQGQPDTLHENIMSAGRGVSDAR